MLFTTVTTTKAPCPIADFKRTTYGCFYTKATNVKNWHDVEGARQKYGSHVHLATLDTQDVGTFMIWHCACWNGILNTCAIIMLKIIGNIHTFKLKFIFFSYVLIFSMVSRWFNPWRLYQQLYLYSRIYKKSPW